MAGWLAQHSHGKPDNRLTGESSQERDSDDVKTSARDMKHPPTPKIVNKLPILSPVLRTWMSIDMPSDTSIGISRQRQVLDFSFNLLQLVAVYLASQLYIWALSFGLAPIGYGSFSPILGMGIIFVLASIVQMFWKGCVTWYNQWMKPKAEFFNLHLGVAFSIPVVLMNHRDNNLDGGYILCIVGIFVLMNVLSWIAVLVSSILAIKLCATIQEWIMNKSNSGRLRLDSVTSSLGILDHFEKDELFPTTSFTMSVAGDRDDLNANNQPHGEEDGVRAGSLAILATTIRAHWPILLPFFGIWILGVPVEIATHDPRCLDAFVLCFIWTSVVRLHDLSKMSEFVKSRKYLQNIFVVLLNPILLTTFLLLAYTRAKAFALHGVGLRQVLKHLSRGTPTYAIWTAVVEGTRVPHNPKNWFGAGDAALSLLEVGLILWGFKLFECRHALFNVVGAMTVIICVMAAVGNVFASVMVARALGLKQAEALAFAARSTTLDMAEPAMVALGGNAGVNAILVIANGLLGQLMYPFTFDKLCSQWTEETAEADQEEQGSISRLGERTAAKLRLETAEFLAAVVGISIGVNGAAMGVAYLYEKKSLAAPYAALAMVTFGVATAVLTSVDPFHAALVRWSID